MYEWLEGLQKSAKRTAAGVDTEEVRRAETECGVPFPEELGALYRTFNGGELQGDVTLFPLHGPEGAPSVLEKTRLKLESLPAAGVWRIGVKGPHRQLFAARKSAMVEQADSPLPGWAEPLSGEDWIYGTWETEKRELQLYRSLQGMFEVLVTSAKVEESGDSALNELQVEYEEGERPEATAQEGEEEVEKGKVEARGEEGEADEESGRTVITVAKRRVQKPRQSVAKEPAAPSARARSTAKKAAAEVKGAVKKVVKSAAKAPARKAPTKKAPAGKAAAKRASTKAPVKKAPAKKAAARKAPARKAPARKAAGTRATGKRGAARGRR